MRANPIDILSHFYIPRTAREVADKQGYDVKQVRTTLYNRMKIGEVAIVGSSSYKGRHSYIFKYNNERVKTYAKPTKLTRKLISLTDDEWRKLQTMTNTLKYSKAIKKLLL